jgi:hypothetical protein
MSQPTPDQPRENPPATRLYSVPRRYDLATMFTVSLVYALYFGLMRLTTAPPAVVAMIATFITVVGLAQALVFKGKSPRLASILAGFLFFLVSGMLLAIRSRNVPSFVEACFMALCSGVPLGYLAGVAVGGVFLVADLVRKAMRLVRRDRRATDVAERDARNDSPFA